MDDRGLRRKGGFGMKPFPWILDLLRYSFATVLMKHPGIAVNMP
jgi:hypothetical protein